jgi:FkbM family methyltransferase
MNSYPNELSEHDLGKWGKARFRQWKHPREGFKEFTEKQIDWLAQFIAPGDSCVDIGAYSGDTALPMAVAAGANGEVVAYEPNAVTYSILYENSKLNPQFAPIKCRNKAIGMKKGVEVFHYDATRMNGGQLVEGEDVRVRVERLDTFKFKGRIAYVKIDTEGQDAAIFAGYFGLLKESKSVVQVERYPYLNRLGNEMLWRVITEYGTAFIEGDWDRKPLTSLPPNLTNIVITPHPDSPAKRASDNPIVFNRMPMSEPAYA